MDPTEPNRVWYFERPRGTFLGAIDHPVIGRVERTGAEYIGPPEARSVLAIHTGLILRASGAEEVEANNRNIALYIKEIFHPMLPFALPLVSIVPMQQLAILIAIMKDFNTRSIVSNSHHPFFGMQYIRSSSAVQSLFANLLFQPF